MDHDPHNLLRTQDLEPWYEENSNLYLFSRESFAATDARIGRVPLLFPTPLLESIDIDNHETWCLAEMVAFSRNVIGSNTADTLREAILHEHSIGLAYQRTLSSPSFCGR